MPEKNNSGFSIFIQRPLNPQIKSRCDAKRLLPLPANGNTTQQLGVISGLRISQPLFWSNACSQYTHRYNFFLSSTRRNSCTNSCSVAVMHLGFLHLIMPTTRLGRDSFFFSMIFPLSMIFTVIF